MKRLLSAISIVGSLLCFIPDTFAQDVSFNDILPGLRERAIVLDITARVVEHNQTEVWNSVSSKVTIPGRPVNLQLVGANIVIAIQFTPYFPRNGANVLVAQGQIWIDVPNQGIRYQTTMQTIPLEFGEPIYFFPLGSIPSDDEARIEIQIQLHPYSVPVPSEGMSIGAPEPVENNTP